MLSIADGRFYLPSRNRPKSLARFFKAWNEMGATCPGAIVLNVDDWNANIAAYESLELPRGWEFAFAEADSLCDALRFCWPSMKEQAWVAMVDDDYIPETPGFDLRMVEALNGHNFISTNDCWQAKPDIRAGRMCGAWAFSGDLLRAVGYFIPEGLRKSYGDDVWETIGRATGTWTVRMDIIARHLHHMNGKADVDETSAQVGKHWIHDTQVFRRWKVGSAHWAGRATPNGGRNTRALVASLCRVCWKGSVFGQRQMAAKHRKSVWALDTRGRYVKMDRRTSLVRLRAHCKWEMSDMELGTWDFKG